MEHRAWGYYISWMGVAIIVIWVLLKSLGVIHSPPWQELAPYFGAAVAFGGLITTINNLGGDIKELKVEIKEIRDKVHHLDKDVEIIKTKVV